MNRLLKKAHLSRASRDSLILALLDKKPLPWRWGGSIVASQKNEEQSLHTSNRASRCSVHVGAIHELPLRKDFGRPRKRDFAGLNLHLPACA
jgi:hypothetical protein